MAFQTWQWLMPMMIMDGEVQVKSEQDLQELLVDNVSDEDIQSFITYVDTKVLDPGDMETVSIS